MAGLGDGVEEDGGGEGGGKKEKGIAGPAGGLFALLRARTRHSVLSAPFLSRARQYPFETLPFISLSLSLFFLSFSLSRFSVLSFSRSRTSRAIAG